MCVCVCMHVCTYVCVCERESMYMHVCMCNYIMCTNWLMHRSIREEGPELSNVDDLEEDEESLVIDQEQWQGLIAIHN